jgi:hypothetical protein
VNVNVHAFGENNYMKRDLVLKAADAVSNAIDDGRLVNGEKLLEIVFHDDCRPTVRWLKHQQKLKRVPFRKIGRLVFFDVDEVLAAWRGRFTVGKISGGKP